MPKKSEPPEPETSIQKMCENTEKDAANIEQVIKTATPKHEPAPAPPPPPIPQ